MNHRDILRRSWQLMLQYRVLWVFGLLVALASSSGSGNGNASFSGDNSQPDTESTSQFDCNEAGDCYFTDPGLSEMPGMAGDTFEFNVWTVAAIGGAILLVIVLLTIVVTVLRYIGETALIALVDDHETTGEQRTWREGFRLGWSAGAWRIFVINLLTDGVLFLTAILLLGLATGAALLTLGPDGMPNIPVVIAASLFAFVVILLTIGVALVLVPIKQLARRAAVIDDARALPALRDAIGLARSYLRDVGLMWLIMLGIEFAYAIVMFPVSLVVLVVAAIVAGVLAAIAWGITALVSSTSFAWLPAIVVGLPIFILVLSVPLLFVGALAVVFRGNVWTLTYRELQALSALTNGSTEGDANVSPSPA